MSNQDRRRFSPSSHHGGAHRVIPDGSQSIEPPQHGLDVAIAEAALEHCRKWLLIEVMKGKKKHEEASREGGVVEAPKMNALGQRSPSFCAARDMFHLAKDVARMLHQDPWKTMSPRQREVLLRFVPEALREKLSKPGAPSVPLSLQNLPKRPPQFAKMVPQGIRKKLNLKDLKVLSGALLVKDRIEAHFDAVYASESRLRKWKRQEGYCGGRAYCMVFTGHEVATCRACLAEMSRMKRGETRKNVRSEYGTIRHKERAQEKKERDDR